MKPIIINIHGSCVSRDLFRGQEDSPLVVGVYRTEYDFFNDGCAGENQRPFISRKGNVEEAARTDGLREEAVQLLSGASVRHSPARWH